MVPTSGMHKVHVSWPPMHSAKAHLHVVRPAKRRLLPAPLLLTFPARTHAVPSEPDQNPNPEPRNTSTSAS